MERRTSTQVPARYRVKVAYADVGMGLRPGEQDKDVRHFLIEKEVHSVFLAPYQEIVARKGHLTLHANKAKFN